MPRGRRGSRQRRTWPCPHRPPCQGRHRDRDNARPGRPGTARPPGAATDPGARLNLPVGAGRATAGTASTPAKQCVVTDRILRPPSFASPRRSPRASPCLTCLDTENALRPGNTPDPGEITFAIRLTNSGETGYAPATFTDSLTGVVDDASYGDDATATVGTLQY